MSYATQQGAPPEYPTERLVACLNRDLAKLRAHKRQALRAHILLCILAYYVEWHMREAWRELMFADPEQAAKDNRDPVAPAQRSQAALAKTARRALDDGTPVHSFSTLMAKMATIVRNTCRTPEQGPDSPTFEIVTTANAKQRRALELIGQIQV